jgi:hypothetical protein
VYGWPTPAILAASTAALAASVLTLAGVPLLPSVWRAEPQAAGWSTARKARYTVTLAVFAALGLLLAPWGALAPWNT